MRSTLSLCFKKRSITVAAVALLGALSLPARAVEPFTLQDIRVEGLQHAEPGTVFASLPFRIGEVYDDDKGTTAIQSLYATGLFSDVRLSTYNGVLVISVQERPTIASLSFTGAKAFDNQALISALRSVGIAEGRPFDKALADQAEQEIKRQYLSQSYYSAAVEITSTPIENNRVNVNFIITEGSVAKINEIRIIGNHDVSTSRLLSEMSLTSGGWLTWYTKNDRYSREKLNADLEKIRSYYLNRGYLDFQINSTQVEITPDKESIALIVDLTEGPQYILSSVELEGDYLGREDEFKSIIDLSIGKPYNASEVSALVKSFSEKFGSYGFAFAQIQPQPSIDRENGTVALRVVSRPQRRVYVRHVNIRGNDRTRDEVIRREFRQFESAWYDWDKIQLSRDRVDRLGFFTEVNLETSPVPNTDDQVDITMQVTEKPTGSLTLGAGFSSDDKVSVNAGISQENVFGTGNYLGLGISSSKYNRQFRLSTLNPYFTQEGVSRGFDLYYTTTRPYSSTSSSQYYSIETAGAAFRFGVPFSEVDKVYFGLGGETTRIKPGWELPRAYEQYIEQYGERSTYFPLTIGWGRDSRDSSLVPTKGTLHRLNGELSLLGDTHYFKGTYQYQRWIPLGRDFTFAFNGEIGYGRGIGSKDFPVFKNFYGGGQGFVRGFESGTFGRYDIATDTYSGGARSYNVNLELYAPFPGSGSDRTLRLSAFLDYGNVATDYETSIVNYEYVDSKRSGWQFSDARMSVGFGFSWISPLGPLKFSYAIPIKKNDDDKIERFQFQIGTSF
ncbi:Outer membrane protein assembly factor BamA [Saezia sanguinis]|jgi:outer membrane protein insertion porin family|uniref:Outer membrane protein assembly factor BamA n=1 Tax=Saezia sanguinis TaxID=1965230 RepID=A0A433SGX7_9BURK|nr:outer membrane protein assembly factor BamA [Saezia sanguinis]RUS68011.1 Outer membrane protein assembly factor BamA [Saezia sanguinis]